MNERVVVEYLHNMRTMIDDQRAVMLSYLGLPGERAIVAAPVRVVEAPVRVAAPALEVAPAPAQISVLDPMQLVISIVSERTGYPLETLGIDLDLEADLSIDSIKRIEIIGELAQRLGLRVDKGARDADAMVEELATRKTLRALVAWFSERVPQPNARVAPLATELAAAA